MKHSFFVLTLLFWAHSSFATQADSLNYKFGQRVLSKNTLNMHLCLKAGYKNGAGGDAGLVLSDFATGFPLSLKFSIGYSNFNPGNADLAREIFINDATNGTPEKKGWYWDYKVDFLYKYPMLGSEQAYIYAGIRHARFTGNFNYIGANEEFDIISNAWGIGTGVELNYPITSKLYLSFNAGADYFFPAAMNGHGTIYNPDDENVNPRKDFSYSDADKAVNNPKLSLKATAGLSFKL